MDLVRNFGLRLGPTNEMHTAISLNITQPSKTKDDADSRPCHRRISEICYNVRYFARHGRPGVRSQWSERQVGVYHGLSEHKETKSICSRLVTIQLPDQLRRRVEGIAGEAVKSDDESQLQHHISCHIVVFFGLAVDWRSYICFLEGLLDALVSCHLSPSSNQTIPTNKGTPPQ